ncbi:hypothetical protein SAMN03159288_03930 [Rhizobium sp. NFACC06-2]|nr:hypothetical protein SAMN03159288_03930 [Rhizobium sp. NFACC06-2]
MQYWAVRLVFVFCVDWVQEVKVLLERQRVPPSVALVAYHLLKWLERKLRAALDWQPLE